VDRYLAVSQYHQLSVATGVSGRFDASSEICSAATELNIEASQRSNGSRLDCGRARAPWCPSGACRGATFVYWSRDLHTTECVWFGNPGNCLRRLSAM
jgi:hypothetical protein